MLRIPTCIADLGLLQKTRGQASEHSSRRKQFPRSPRCLPGRQWLLLDRMGAALAGIYETLVVATPKNSGRRAWPRTALAAGPRESDRSLRESKSAQRSLRPGTPSGEDLEQAVDPLKGQDRSLHLWAIPQRPAREAAAPLGRPSHLNNRTSAV